MGNLEDILAQGVRDEQIPHAVVFATNADGSFTYKHAVGTSENSIFLLASSTKLMTSISALQIAERGLFGLDQDVSSQLPELAEQKILTGFDGNDEPILEERRNVLTLRHLLTHTSGLAYDAGDPGLTKLALKRGHEPNTGPTISERFLYPLLFEPGTGWMYGSSIDWAGKLIERLTNQTLEEYFQRNINEPLGIKSVHFFSDRDEAVKAKIPGLTMRTPGGGLVPFDQPFITTGAEDCFGGHGAYSDMEDYLKVQRSILANDGKLLRSESVDLMFTPQLSEQSRLALQEFRLTPYGALFIGENDVNIPVNWGIGGILFMKDDIGRRKKGTLNWGGAANTFWTIDRDADLALTFGTQVIPPGDRKVARMIMQVEVGMYELAGVRV